jgi:hypothetical protein
MHCSVSNSGRNGQFRFRARTWFAPEFHLSPDSFRALADARQIPSATGGPLLQDLTVDALSIISNPQPEELAIVRDLGLDAAGNCAGGHSGMKTATTTVRTSRNSRLLGECRRKSMFFRVRRWVVNSENHLDTIPP